jgi:hypothetical protein
VQIKPAVAKLQWCARPQDPHAASHSKSFDEPGGEPAEVIKLVWRKPKQYLCSQFPRLAELISRDPEAGLRKFSVLRQLQLWLKRPQ